MLALASMAVEYGARRRVVARVVSSNVSDKYCLRRALADCVAARNRHNAACHGCVFSLILFCCCWRLSLSSAMSAIMRFGIIMRCYRNARLCRPRRRHVIENLLWLYKQLINAGSNRLNGAILLTDVLTLFLLTKTLKRFRRVKLIATFPLTTGS